MPKLDVDYDLTYPTFFTEELVGKNSLTEARAKDLLGWQTEKETGIRFFDDLLLTDKYGDAVRCTNNSKNRPFTLSWCLALAQDVLNRKWKFNGETIVIGKSGRVLSGQHRLIALVLACQMWRLAQYDTRWKTLWKSEPMIETVISFGIDESPDCVRTLDNVRSRTLSDVLSTSGLFDDYTPKNRKVVTRLADYAIRFLWYRTGVDANPFSARQTHSESWDFVNRHPRLIDSVKHIYEEDQGRAIRSKVSPGYAAGLMYLMATSASNADSYQSNDPPREVSLDFSRWDSAAEFWTNFVATGLEELHTVLASLAGDDSDRGSRVMEEVAAVIKAWNLFVSNSTLEVDAIMPTFTLDGNGIRCLAENPGVGGIDVCGQEVIDDD